MFSFYGRNMHANFFFCQIVLVKNRDSFSHSRQIFNYIYIVGFSTVQNNPRGIVASVYSFPWLRLILKSWSPAKRSMF